MGDKEELAEAVGTLVEWFAEDVDGAIAAIEENAKDLDGSTRAVMFLHLGDGYMGLNKPQAAEAIFRRALCTFEEEGDVVGQASAWFNLGLVLLQMGDLDRAAAAFEESLARDLATEQLHAIEQDHDRLLDVHTKRGDLVAAEPHLRALVGFCEGRGEPLEAGGRFVFFGNTALQLMNFTVAELAFVSAKDCAERARRPAAVATALAGMALALNKQRRYEEAIAVCEAALALEDTFAARAAVYSALAEAHGWRSDLKASFHYRSLQLELQAVDGDPEACLALQSLYTFTESERDIPRAIASAQRAREIFLKRGNRAGAARCLRSVAQSWANDGQLEKATEAATAALEEIRAVGDEKAELEMIEELAGYRFEQHQQEEAARLFEKACILARQHGAPQRVAENEFRLALCLLYSNHLLSALSHNEAAVAAAELADDAELHARCLLGLAESLTSLGRPAEAVARAEAALRITPPSEARHAHGILGHALYQLGEYTRAIEHLEEALRLLQEMMAAPGLLPHIRAGQSEAHLKLSTNLATSFQDAGRHDQALQLLSEQAATHQALLLSIDDSIFLYNTARSLFALDRVPEAIETLERAIEQARKAGNLDIERKAHSFLAPLHWNTTGDQQAAYRHVRAAVELAERTLAGIYAEDFMRSFAPTVEKTYRLAVEICLRLYRWEEAFVYAERAKARALANLLSASEVQPKVPLDSEAHALLAEEARHLAVLRASHRSSRLGRAVPVEEAIESLREIWNQLAPIDPEYVALRRDDPIPLGSVRRFLDAQTRPVVLVEHFLLPRFLATFVLSSRDTEVNVALAPLNEDDLPAIRQDFQRGIVEMPWHESRDDAWQRHSALLIDPIAPYLQKGNLVCFIPFGPFHGLPLHALSLNGEPLLLRHPVAYCGSSTVLTRLFRRSGGSRGPCAAFGPADKKCSFEEEAQSIARKLGGEALTGDAATCQAAFDALGSAGLLHFACHGQFDAEDPLSSGLLLTDGALTVRDLLDRRIAADLVTLSACESGVQARFAGDELLGMAHALFYAGAPSVLASLWRVSDRATLALMTAFYEELAAGTDKAEALRRAQLTVRERWEHPYYWASFALMGSWATAAAQGEAC